jgi:release factor glutamine methyltransferase
MFEIGYDQGQAVSELMQQAGFVDVKVLQDYCGKDRVVMGHL